MYVPKLYKNENIDEIIDFVKNNNFGILVSQNINEKIIATHIPFVVSKRENRLILTSHISIANEQWRNFQDEKQVLVIFSGEHAYISSSWYDHPNVPTWNYIAVHLYGTVKVLSVDETLSHLDSLVSQHEVHEANPVSIEKLGEQYVRKEMAGLVAFDIHISEMQSAFKLSQNRDEKNIHGIIEALEKRGDENAMAIVGAIKKQRKM